MKATSAVEAEVTNTLTALFAALAAPDAEAFVSLFAPDPDVCLLTSSGGSATGPAAIREWRDRVGPSPAPYELMLHSVGATGDVAWASGEAVERSDGQCANATPFTAVLERRDGKWLVQQVQWAVAGAPARPDLAAATSLDAVALVVEQERVDLCNCAAPDGTVTLLFSDIENSTPLAEALGDLRWIDVLRRHNAIIRECISRHEGEEVKTIGDAFMVAFGSARRALLCAVDIQRAFDEPSDAPSAETGTDEPLKVRIGLHAGEPVRDAGDFYGKSVVLASRIAGQAQGGQILVSALLRELAEGAGDIRFDEGYEATLKGLAGTHRLYAVLPG